MCRVQPWGTSWSVHSGRQGGTTMMRKKISAIGTRRQFILYHVIGLLSIVTNQHSRGLHYWRCVRNLLDRPHLQNRSHKRAGAQPDQPPSNVCSWCEYIESTVWAETILKTGTQVEMAGPLLVPQLISTCVFQWNGGHILVNDKTTLWQRRQCIAPWDPGRPAARLPPPCALDRSLWASSSTQSHLHEKESGKV